MSAGRRLALGGLLGLVVSGCTPPGSTGMGSAQIALPMARRVQYVSADVQVARVTLTHQTTGRSYVQTFPGTALVKNRTGSSFSFVADNLPVGPYVATLEAFLDPACTQSAGSSTSAPFSIAALQLTPITLPDLVLDPTPVGDWQVMVEVALSGGYAVTKYTSELQTPDGTIVKGPSGTTLPASSSLTWGNVPNFPVGVSTCSLTVTASAKRLPRLTQTRIATVSLLPDATVSSTVSFTFP